jgi:hypothetical protein
MTYAIVAVLGTLVGATELMSRYRDAPFRSIATWGALIYLGINSIAAMTALFLLDTFGQELIQKYPDSTQRSVARVLIAGFGAIVLLRSSLFRIKVDQSDVSIGPAAILDVLLRVSDRDVDRSRALRRADEIPALMLDITAKIASDELPSLCLALMQNLSPDEQRALGDQVKLINNQEKLSDVSKAVNIGLLLTGFVGTGVLRRAVASIKDRPSPPPLPPSIAADEIKRDLATDRGSNP